jgi:predicted nuclease of predicted toxin-antitoxin system
MATLYADENFDLDVVMELRNFGHDILRAQEAGQANQKITDDQVLAFAISLGRAVLTHDRRDFIKLHKQDPNHAGIIVCTGDEDAPALAQRIHIAIQNQSPSAGKLIRVNRPAHT